MQKLIKKEDVRTNGSEIREELLRVRGRSMWFCELTGMSLGLSDDIVRVGPDRYVGADFLPLSSSSDIEDICNEIQERRELQQELFDLEDDLSYLNDRIDNLEEEKVNLEQDIADARMKLEDAA